MSVNSLHKFPEENPNPVMRLSKQGQLLYGNKASENLLDCWGQRASEFIRGRALEVLYNAVEAQAPVIEDFACRGRYFTVTFAPIAGSNYVNAYALDTTEKKQMEEALQTALDEVRQLRNRLQIENRYLREEIRTELGFDSMIGNSDPQKRLMHAVRQVAVTDATVLITGETGTGKELIARAVHAASRRRAKPLIKINCAALPKDLVESELFGHQKGAFTGALANKMGRFELADGGTLFLDEIGDIPLESQSKLLRALQEQEFERVGGSKTIRVDVRVIAATNRILAERIADGEFREDLFYRLNVFPLHSPPLRERREDIPTLAAHFLDKYSRKIGRRIDRIDDSVMQRLQDYAWPGNVRELENIIERSVILSEGSELQLDEAFEINPAPSVTKPPSPASSSERKTLVQMEREMIESALDDCNGRVEGEQGAAARLAMAPSTLRERIKKYGIARSGRRQQAAPEKA